MKRVKAPFRDMSLLRKTLDSYKDDPEGLRRFMKLEAAYEQSLAGGRDMYFVSSMQYDGVRAGILPFGAPRWSVYDVENHRFGKDWLAGSTGLICQRTDQARTRASRIIWTGGSPPSKRDRIGISFTARHDQTGAKLGVYEIVGIVVYDPWGNVGLTQGNVPSYKLAENTYK